MSAGGPIITGAGMVTALGSSVEQTYERLLAGCFISTHSPACVAPVPGQARATQLALLAGREALVEARWGSDELRDDRTALLVGSSRGPVNEWLGGSLPPGDLGIHTVARDIAGALRLGSGPRLTCSAACASGLQALVRSAIMLRAGEIDRALVIGVEAPLHPLFLACFRRLGVLPRDGVGCRPFDESRQGFLVSEAAGALCVERNSAGGGLLAIDRFAFGSDAVSITASDAGAEVLKSMLRQVVAGGGVDLIHAHGTGTVANDPAELRAFEQTCVIGGRAPSIYSHKGAIGHSLGASGVVSAALSCRMHARGVVLPNVRTQTPLATRSLRLSASAHTRHVRRSLCVAAGFGGPVAVVSFESCGQS